MGCKSGLENFPGALRRPIGILENIFNFKKSDFYFNKVFFLLILLAATVGFEFKSTS